MALKKFSLRFQNRLYLSALLIIGAFSLPFVSSCGNAKDSEKEQQRIKDSIANATHIQDSIAKVKADSTATAIKEKAIQDSIRKADSIAKAKQQQIKFKPVVVPQTKYGIPANLRND